MVRFPVLENPFRPDSVTNYADIGTRGEIITDFTRTGPEFVFFANKIIFGARVCVCVRGNEGRNGVTFFERVKNDIQAPRVP